MVLIAHQDTCSAILISQGPSPKASHLPLPSLELHDLLVLGHYVRDPNMRQGFGMEGESATRAIKKAKPGQTKPATKSGGNTEGNIKEKFDAAAVDADRLLLELWTHVVKPVVEALNLKVCERCNLSHR